MIMEYDGRYFEEKAEELGLILKSHRPLWTRWIKIIQNYKATGRLLDVGCGPGYFLAVAEKYYDAYGIDISGYAIKEAKQRTNLTTLSIGEATKLNYKDNSFDILTCFDLLEHLLHPERAVEEFYRILKKNSILIVRVPNTNSLGVKLKDEEWFGYRDETHVSLWSNTEWLCLLKNNCFDILEIFYDGLWDTPYYKKSPKILQDIFIKIPLMALFWFGIRYTKSLGENLCVIATKR